MHPRHTPAARRFRSLTSIIALSFAFVSSAATFRAAEPTDHDGAIRVACIGDSITAGYALKHPTRDAYPAQLSRMLGAGWDVRNFGISGATLMNKGNMPYDQQPPYRAAIASKPDIAVIALGTNDTKTVNIAAHPEDFIPSYEALIAALREANPHVKILLCLPPPAFPAAMGIADDVLVKEILPRIREVARKENLPLIDLYTAMHDQAAHFPDRIHPDPEAAGLIAQAVEKALVQVSGRGPGKPVATESEARADAFPLLRPDATVVFVGDSITDGGRARKGNDYNHTMGQSYAFIIAALLGEKLPQRNLQFVNRGNSGNTVVDLQARWQTDVLELKPDVVSILVGINDTLSPRGETLEQFEQGYDGLLRETIAALPKATVILGEPFVLPVGKRAANYATTRAELEKRQEIVTKLAAKYHVTLIRYQDIFDQACQRAPAEHWSWDGIHPHYAGHGLMAEAWINTVEKLTR